MVSPCTIYSVIGIGFGPANLAVAGALLEQHRDTAEKTLFIERHHEFQWHPGMLLPGARMQIRYVQLYVESIFKETKGKEHKFPERFSNPKIPAISHHLPCILAYPKPPG